MKQYNALPATRKSQQDPTKENKMGEKLRLKYMVFKIGDDGETQQPSMLSTDPEDIDSPFVLMPRKDPAAFRAMITYANFCEPDLRAEIVQWLELITEEGLELGTQGARNAKEILGREIEIGLSS